MYLESKDPVYWIFEEHIFSDNEFEPVPLENIELIDESDLTGDETLVEE